MSMLPEKSKPVRSPLLVTKAALPAKNEPSVIAPLTVQVELGGYRYVDSLIFRSEVFFLTAGVRERKVTLREIVRLNTIVKMNECIYR